MEAIARELVRWDVIADVAGLDALGQQVSDEVVELLLGAGDVFTSMQGCREGGAVVLVADRGVGLEHRFEPRTRAAGSSTGLGQVAEVAGDLAFVPGHEDRFNT